MRTRDIVARTEFVDGNGVSNAFCGCELGIEGAHGGIAAGEDGRVNATVLGSCCCWSSRGLLLAMKEGVRHVGILGLPTCSHP